MANREDIKKIIAYMKLVFPNYNPDVTNHPNTIDVFEDLLGDLDAERLQMGVRAACKEARAFAPSPGEIRAALANSFNPIEAEQRQIAKSFERFVEDLEERNVKLIQ